MERQPSLRIPPTYVVMLAGFAGFLVGPLLLRLGAGSEFERLLDDSGPFTLWGALIGGQTALWLLALPPLWLILSRHRSKAAAAGLSARREVLLSLAALVLLVGVLILAAATNPVPEFLPHLRWKVRALTVGALLVAAVAAAAVWVIRVRLEGLRGAEPTKENLADYLELRADLERLLAFLGAIVGLAVLSSAGMRSVVSDVLPGSLPDFPAEAVIVYGLVLSLLLAAVYLPTFAVARATGVAFRDKLAAFPDPEKLVDGMDAQRKLDEALGLTVSATASFRASVAILSPLLGGLASLIPQLGG